MSQEFLWITGKKENNYFYFFFSLPIKSSNKTKRKEKVKNKNDFFNCYDFIVKQN